MNEVATDISHPNWIKLENVLKSVSDVIFEIAEFYIDKKKMRMEEDKRRLISETTLNVSKACIEIIDNTCVVMGTIYCIVKDSLTQEQNNFGEAKIRNKKEERTQYAVSKTKFYDGNNYSHSIAMKGNVNAIGALLEVALDEMKNIVNREKLNEKEITNKDMKQKAVKRTTKKVKYKYENKSIVKKKMT